MGSGTIDGPRAGDIVVWKSNTSEGRYFVESVVDGKLHLRPLGKPCIMNVEWFVKEPLGERR